MADNPSPISRVAEKLWARRPPPPSSLPPDSTTRILSDLDDVFKSIRSHIQDAEEKGDHGESARLLQRELRCVAFEAEDALDEYEYEVLRARAEAGEQAPRGVSGSTITSSVPPPLDDLFLGKMAPRMGKIRDRFDEISKQHGAFRLREEDGEARRQKAAAPPPSSSRAIVSRIHGREEEKNRLVDGLLLLEEFQGRNLSVVPIVGMGGVGKTALAQLVYNDPRVRGHFRKRAWVCVSTDFKVEGLIKRIAEAFTKIGRCPNELSVFQEILREELGGERFLLVLDDLWNRDADVWPRLKGSLSCGAQGSAIVVTTRDEAVAKIAQTVPFLRLGCLPFDDGWAVFQAHAFGGGVLDPSGNQDLVEIGKKIVRKCKGLPLSVKALAGLLRYESNIKAWNDVLGSEIWDRGEEILPSLRLSYCHLPTALKPCFEYCSLFPKDMLFTRDQLILLWVAQGFVQVAEDGQFEDTCVLYFDELLQRSLFQYEQDFSTEYEQRFMMHDLIHDLALSVSERQCSIVEDDKFSRLSLKNGVLHHVSFVPHSCDIMTMLQPLTSTVNGALRSLVVIGADRWAERYVVCEIPSEMWQNLESLRALDLSYIPINELPDLVQNLKHLRYLDLSGTGIKMLPAPVCKLYHLQTLVLSFAEIKDLPDSIKNLKQLHYLDLCATELKMLPESIYELHNLQRLDLGYTSINELSESIGNLKQLRFLNLSGTGIQILPESICSLHHMQTLNLSSVDVDELPDPIGNLEHLRYLNLSDTGMEIIPPSVCNFCHLETLDLSFTKIKELPESIENLRSLRYLELSGTNISSLPESLSKLSNLQILWRNFSSSFGHLRMRGNSWFKHDF